MSKKETFWIPYADLMTVLMIIFLFISLSYMGLVQFQKNQQDEIFKEYKQTKQTLYKELDKTFTEKFKDYNLKVNPDLSIQITDANALFPVQFYDQEVILTDRFKTFLNEFTPLFLSIILKDQYLESISEIRIEGHTALQTEDKENDKVYYQKMLTLSQKRSNKVLEHMMNLSYYDQLAESKKTLLRFITTSNGLAYGKALDSEGNFKFLSGKSINTEKSMRVEFRIVTTSEKLVEKVLEQLNK
ncbi:MAG: hypothetical protein Q8K70_01400 [Bacteroidota bacterium]|nr:hypothetical protein [Bacteroidota bacterium]